MSRRSSPKQPSAMNGCVNATEEENGISYYLDPITLNRIDPSKLYKQYIGKNSETQEPIYQCYDIDTIYEYVINKKKTKDMNRQPIPPRMILDIIVRYMEVNRQTPDHIKRWINEASIRKTLKDLNVLNYVYLYCIYQGILNLPSLLTKDAEENLPVVLQDKNYVYLYNPKIYKTKGVYEWIRMSLREPNHIQLITPSIETIESFLDEHAATKHVPTDKNRIHMIAFLNLLDTSKDKAVKDHLDAYYKIPLEGLIVAYNYSYAKYFKEVLPLSIVVYNTNYLNEQKPVFKYLNTRINILNKDLDSTVSLNPPGVEIIYLGYIGNFLLRNTNDSVFEDIDKCAKGILNALSYSFNRLNAKDTATVIKHIRENYHVKEDLKLLDSPRRHSTSSRPSSGGSGAQRRCSKFDAMTVKDLQGLCRDRAIAYSGLRKAELILKLQRKK